MSVELAGIRLPLAAFELQIDATLSGRVTALYGASGAGKTSLLEVIAGLRRPSAGRVSVDGAVLTDASIGMHVRPERRAIGYVPQEGALFPHLTVRQNLLFGAGGRGGRPEGLTFRHVTDVLEIVPLAERRVQALSGGERQRVALGRALLSAPRLLLLDEPLAGLDAPLRSRLLPYLAKVRDEFAIPMLYVTHSPDEVMALCDDVLVLSRGRLEERGAPAAIFVPGTAARYSRCREST